jgi:hypothetical protein
MIFPVILGSGDKLYPECAHLTPFELIEVKPFPTGVVAQTYRRAAAMPAIDPACAEACADPLEAEDAARLSLRLEQYGYALANQAAASSVKTA